MERKQFSLELKDSDDNTGEFSAVISTLGVVDKDNDVTLPGAFPKNKEVLVSAYGHMSWGGVLPVGRASISERGKEARAEGQFWLNTTVGQDTYNTVKNAGNLQEWSYGFEVKEFSFGEHEGQKVRFIKAINPFEISPVLVGAGENTRTLSIKENLSLDIKDQDTYIAHAESIMDAVAGFEGRALRRLEYRRKGGDAGLTQGEIEYWEQLRDIALRVLEKVASQTTRELEHQQLSELESRALQQFVEFQKLKAAMNGVPFNSECNDDDDN